VKVLRLLSESVPYASIRYGEGPGFYLLLLCLERVRVVGTGGSLEYRYVNSKLGFHLEGIRHFEEGAEKHSR
jgi:hypothetical protein